MANKRKPKKNLAKSLYDTLAHRLLTSIDPDRTTDENISEKRSEFNYIINNELERAKGISSGSLIDFHRNIMLNDNTPKNSWDSSNITTDIIDHINKNSSTIIQEFSSAERNKYVEYRDYNFITSFVPKISQGIRVMLTHIVSSDDLSGQVSRNFDLPASLIDADKEVLLSAIRRFEDKSKLPIKLKNIVFKNTLIMGEYYVYAVPYQKLFKDYHKVLEQKKQAQKPVSLHQRKKGKRADNSFTYAGESVLELEPELIKEFQKELSTMDIFDKKITKDPAMAGGNLSEITSTFGDISTVKVIESAVPFFVEDDGVMDDATLSIAQEAIFGNPDIALEAATPDGTKDINDNSFNVSGIYLKYISSRNIIPVEILNTVVGYFYMVTNTVDRSKQALSITNSNITTNKKQSPLQNIAQALSSKIAAEFSDKFVSNNSQFKQLIADCIIANGVTNTEYKIQFIPAEDMIRFSVNEDENGHGKSMLADAKYPAKTLAAISMRKTLNYVNNSGDKTVLTLRGGSADISYRNRANQVIRNLQEQNIVVSDIIGDFNNVFHKYAANGYILMPTSKSGQKLVELEKLEGQEMRMDGDWEKAKEDECLIAMGTPPLMIEQFQQADFAKSYTSAHQGFAGIVIGLQTDLEEPTTRLYKKIISTLDISTEIKQHVENSFRFKLPRPKYSTVQTSTETLQNASSLADSIIQLQIGDDAPDEMKDVMREAKYQIVKELATCIDFSHFEKIVDYTKLQKMKIKDDTKEVDTQLSNEDESF